MQNEFVTIGLVDGLSALRKGLALFLQHHGPYTITLQAADGPALKEELKKAKAVPDILLLEVENDGIATAKWLQLSHPTLPVIIYTNLKTELTAEKLYGLGVRAILQKNRCDKELLKAISRVLEDGCFYTDPSSRNQLMRLYKNNNRPESLKPLLTEREERFAQLSVTGLTYAEIADEMEVSVCIISKISGELFKKVNVQNRAELAIKAMENGLINKLAS